MSWLTVGIRFSVRPSCRFHGQTKFGAPALDRACPVYAEDRGASPRSRTPYALNLLAGSVFRASARDGLPARWRYIEVAVWRVKCGEMIFRPRPWHPYGPPILC